MWESAWDGVESEESGRALHAVDGSEDRVVELRPALGVGGLDLEQRGLDRGEMFVRFDLELENELFVEIGHGGRSPVESPDNRASSSSSATR